MSYWRQISFTRLMMLWNPMFKSGISIASSACRIPITFPPFIFIPSIIHFRAAPLQISVFSKVLSFVLIVACWWQYKLISSLTSFPSIPRLINELLNLKCGTLWKAFSKSTKQMYGLYCWEMHFYVSTCRPNKASFVNKHLLKPNCSLGISRSPLFTILLWIIKAWLIRLISLQSSQWRRVGFSGIGMKVPISQYFTCYIYH